MHLKWIILCAALLPLGIALSIALPRLWPLAPEAVAAGRIVEITRPGKGSGFSKGTPPHRLRIDFAADAASTTLSFYDEDTWDSLNPYDVGDAVTVRYSPRNVAETAIVTNIGFWSGSAALMFGIWAMLTGVGALNHLGDRERRLEGGKR